jgi:Raf kinase inhibitor-like YbhB/YbcL family protein
MRAWRLLFLGVSLSACGAAGGGGDPVAAPGVTLESLGVSSSAFPASGEIPVDFTCDGANRSPQLAWSAPPRGTQSFVVIVDDPDAPSGTFTQWIVYNLGAETRSLPEAVDPATLGGASGLNDFKRPEYGGPCPPRLEIHHYNFRVFALNAPLTLPPEPDRDAIDAAMSGHVLAVGTLVGGFSH